MVCTLHTTWRVAHTCVTSIPRKQQQALAAVRSVLNMGDANVVQDLGQQQANHGAEGGQLTDRYDREGRLDGIA